MVRMQGAMKTLFRRILTGWILAFALTGGYWGMLLDAKERWNLYATRSDGWAFLVVTLAGGVLLGLGAFALERVLPRTKPLLAASLWWWLAIAFANNFPDLSKHLAVRAGWPWLDGVVWRVFIWTVGALGTAVVLVVPRLRHLACRGWHFMRCILWPIVFLLPLSAWRLPPHDAAFGRGLDFSRVPGNGRPAVVVLMFDMLGYELLFGEDGQVLPAYTNFAAFCGSADVYRAAESAGPSTSESIPGFIVQERLFDPPRTIRYAAARWLFTDGSGTVEPRDFSAQSLPALAKAAGGRAQAIGMHIPWDEILPEAWTATESLSIYTGNHGIHVFGQAPSFWTTVKEHLAWHFVFTSRSPLGAALKVAGIDDIKEAQGYDERASTVERAGRFLRESLSPGDFFFVHVDMPHFPYLMGPGGERLPPALYHDNHAGLAAQCEGTDWVLGRWMEDLAASPAGRGAWVIVTSDHGLHHASHPGPGKGRKSHVPFLVRRPGQTERRDIDAPADLTDLRHLLPDLPIFAGGEGTGGSGSAEEPAG